jgi:CubicO group peptidase (beta-lactamase class C family)
MSLDDVRITSTSIVASTFKLDQRLFFDSTKYSDIKYSDVKFSDKVDRMKIIGTSAEPKFKVRTFTHWDEVLHYDYIPPSSKPHFFTNFIIPLNVFYAYEGIQRSLEEYVTDYAIAGLMVLREGDIIFEEYHYGLDSESRYHLWGATKSFTGTIVGMALHDGDIRSLDDLTKDYAHQFKGTAYGDVSIRHLLMMSSGVNFFHQKGSPDRFKMYRQIWGGGRDLDDFAAELGLRVAPGTDFNYLDTDTHVLSAILRGVYDKPFHTIVKEKLWEQLGMAGSAFWSKNAPDGHSFGNAGLCPRLIEFAHLGQLYLNDGVWEGKRLLPEGWVHECSTPRTSFQEPKPGNRGYGYQFWIPPDSKGEFMALGAFNQILWIDIERGVVVAQFGANEDEPNLPRTVRESHVVMRAIVDAAVLK